MGTASIKTARALPTLTRCFLLHLPGVPHHCTLTGSEPGFHIAGLYLVLRGQLLGISWNPCSSFWGPLLLALLNICGVQPQGVSFLPPWESAHSFPGKAQVTEDLHRSYKVSAHLQGQSEGPQLSMLKDERWLQRLC